MAKASVGKGSVKSPGSVLRKYIDDFGLSVSSVSLQLKQNSTSFKKILDGKKRITVELALKLAKLFGTSSDFWIDVQKKSALAEAKEDSKLQKELRDLKKAEKNPNGVTRGRAKKEVAGKAGAKKGGPKKAGAKKAVAKKPAGKKTVAKKGAAKASGSGIGSQDTSFSF
ncbi:MAG: HigA family addiction module antidote protein [Spirochaetaceae bacterium]|jgi:addiction module HigA family antidote|nr:HigA family addiction module antidote protein [Spirochaetaceae bacterium]